MFRFMSWLINCCRWISLIFAMQFLWTIQSMGMKTVKRKVLLYGGYRGTNYYGLQMDATKLNHPLFVPTIENDIRIAITKAGYIIPTNSLDLGKIAWSRSSRTDKGVHAARIGFSAKLEIPEHLLTHEIDPKKSLQSFPEIVKSINALLPEDIRFFSCVRMTQGFSAKSAGSWRAYEYILPLQLLRADQKNQLIEDQPLLDQLNGYLSQLEGCNDFHNFHRMSGREITYRLNKRLMPLTPRELSQDLEMDIQDADSITAGDTADEVNQPLINPIDQDNTDLVEIESFTSSNFNVGINVYERWEEIPRKTSRLTRSIIYRCRGSFLEKNGNKYIRVSIIGQSFLLHQIRLMISAAVLSVNKMVPDYFISLAKLNPVLYHLPLAPSNGLVLVNSGFKTVFGEEIASSSKTQQNPKEAVICSDEEDEEAEKLLKIKIYPQIFSDWESNNFNMLTEYLTYCERFRVPEHLTQAWQSIHEQLLQESKKSLEEKTKRDVQRVKKNFEKFRFLIQNERLEKLRNELAPRDFLPSTLSTSMAVKFQITPGFVVNQIMKVLASKILNEEISHDKFIPYYLNFVENQGGIGNRQMSTDYGQLHDGTNVQLLRRWVQSQSIHPIFQGQHK